jgi:hypothetical protein
MYRSDSGTETDDDSCTETDDSDSEDWMSNTMQVLRSNQANLAAAAIVAVNYYMTYLDNHEARVPGQSGHSWTLEVLNTPGESHKMFRMNASLFEMLHNLLLRHGLEPTLHMNSLEALAMFLLICGHGMSMNVVHGIFRHSTETISRKFDEVLNCLVSMAKDYIRPVDPNFSRTHSRLTNDSRMMPYFKDCIGALDGTHISATLPPDAQIRYIGRSGKVTQNVLAIADFDMRFTYASIGQPGSMHDTNVLFHALRLDHDKFPHPPQGKYYLADAGYPNRPGYLAPYKGHRYHVPEWRKGPAPRGQQELFNHLHSCIRNVIERTFGVWKMKWRVVLKMPSYPMKKQKMIVAATMCLHNFIRENDSDDKDFSRCDRNPDYVPTIPKRYRKYTPTNAGDTSTMADDDRDMDKFRDDLSRAIYLSR